MLIKFSEHLGKNWEITLYPNLLGKNFTGSVLACCFEVVSLSEGGWKWQGAMIETMEFVWKFWHLLLRFVLVSCHQIPEISHHLSKFPTFLNINSTLQKFWKKQNSKFYITEKTSFPPGLWLFSLLCPRDSRRTPMTSWSMKRRIDTWPPGYYRRTRRTRRLLTGTKCPRILRFQKRSLEMGRNSSYELGWYNSKILEPQNEEFW